MEVFCVVALSVILEGIITYLKEIFQKTISWQEILAIILSIFACIAYNIDILQFASLNSNIPFVGCVFSGILISRGSNYVFDIINKLQDN